MKEEMTFEQSMQRLDEIVAKLSENDMPLDDSIKLFEEGLRLVKDCNTKLTAYETQINDIIMKNGGANDAA